MQTKATILRVVQSVINDPTRHETDMETAVSDLMAAGINDTAVLLATFDHLADERQPADQRRRAKAAADHLRASMRAHLHG